MATAENFDGPNVFHYESSDDADGFYNFAKLQKIYHERINSGDGADPQTSSVTPMKRIQGKNFKLFSSQNFQESSHSSTNDLVSVKNDEQPTTSFGDDRGRLIYEGSLYYKNYGKNNSEVKKSTWKQFWAVLRKNNKLYLYNERPINLAYNLNFASIDDDEFFTIDVDSAIADVAYDYAKFYKSVFRIVTQNQIEHLFKAENIDDMIRWLENLQNSNNLNENPNGLSNSMALIIKRYESHSLSVSPTSASAKATTKKGMFFKNSTSSSSSKESPTVSISSPANQHHSSTTNGAASKSSSSTSSAEKPHETTPVVKHKKWRKSRKNQNSGSCSSPSTPRSLHPDAVFGQPLEKCPTGESDFVPLIVQLCTKVVERHGLLVVGVYRIPGNTANVNSLISSLDKGFEHADFSDQRWRDVNVVSSLVKAFFRKLPDSLLTDKLYQSFIDSNRIENHSERLKKLRHLVEKLPKINYETLKFLTRHLSKVVAHSHINKMQARNLALMFGPSLLRSTNDSMATMVYHMSDQCQIVESLILYCDWIFTAGDSQVPPTLMSTTPVSRSNNNSFADLNGIRKIDEDFNEAKDDKNVWKNRRNSRKSSKKCSPMSVLNESCGSPTVTPSKICDVTSTANVGAATYNERNIDDEIESRRKICENMFSIEQNYKTSRVELSRVADECRKNRQENIYAARRIFIRGLDGDESSDVADRTDVEGDQMLAKMDCLLKHSRHLNVNPHSLDVFSEETREKIRRFQNDNQMLRHKSQRSSTTPTQRSKLERAFDKIRLESKIVDDATSETSDYSTTSSNMNGYDPSATTTTFAANGHSTKLPRTSSDYSSNASPVTPHCEKNFPVFNGVHKEKRFFFVDSRPNFDRTRNVGVTTIDDGRPVVPWYRECPTNFDSTDSVDCILDLNGNKKCRIDTFSDRKCRPCEPERAQNGFKPKIRSQSTSTDKRRKSFSVSTATDAANAVAKTNMYRSDSTSFFNKNDQKCNGVDSKTRQQFFVQRKPSKTRKLKVWFKESFRRSSPDLAPTDDDAVPEIVTKV